MDLSKYPTMGAFEEPSPADHAQRYRGWGLALLLLLFLAFTVERVLNTSAGTNRGNAAVTRGDRDKSASHPPRPTRDDKPESKATDYQYDHVGDIVRDTRDRQAEFKYDERGRLIRVRAGKASSPESNRVPNRVR